MIPPIPTVSLSLSFLPSLTTLPPTTITDYFSQFGKVTKVRLSRNKKTGKSKHYAFLEFSSPEVARVAAQAMDGYLFVSQKLVARVMSKSEVHADLFKGANRVFKKIPWHKIEEERHNKERTEEQEKKRAERAVKRDAVRQKKIAAAGIEYVFEANGDVKDGNGGGKGKKNVEKKKKKATTTKKKSGGDDQDKKKKTKGSAVIAKVASGATSKR
jgi:nucleolar protein 15